jgi:CIC family chloride channel protein
VEGVGYATITDILTGKLTGVGWLWGLFALKLLTTSLTLGSGGSGGVFSPSLFMGATVGGAFGLALRAVFPHAPFDPAAFALAGMAGMVAGATGAAMTSIVMIFEMTLDYSVVLPMTLTVAVSHGVRRLLLAQNIYTMKLARRGHVMPEALQANAHLVSHVGDMKMATARLVRADELARLIATDGLGAADYVVIVDGETVAGVLERQWAVDHGAALLEAASPASLARRDFVLVVGDTTLVELIAAMQKAKARIAVVRAEEEVGWVAGNLLGVVTEANVMEALAEGMEIFGD